MYLKNSAKSWIEPGKVKQSGVRDRVRRMKIQVPDQPEASKEKTI